MDPGKGRVPRERKGCPKWNRIPHISRAAGLARLQGKTVPKKISRSKELDRGTALATKY